jgi:hypothetical protein
MLELSAGFTGRWEIAHGLSITPTVSFPFRSAATITGAITSTITRAITWTSAGRGRRGGRAQG